MATLKEINENLKAISAIEVISTTYQEISQKKMNEIREIALLNRDFIDKLGKVYSATKNSYFKDVDQIDSDYFKNKKGKVAIFLSANARFFGSLLWSIWHETSKYLNETGADLVVIGDVGKYFASSGEDVRFTYFNLDDEDPNEEEIKEIIDFVKNYQEISVFHGKFQNILTQETIKTDISGQLSERKSKEDIVSYLFEPSPEDVLEFFETELITAFFNQAFLEHRLSRHATRVVSMHQAGENAKEEKVFLRRDAKNIKNQIRDKKQFEITTPYQLWK